MSFTCTATTSIFMQQAALTGSCTVTERLVRSSKTFYYVDISDWWIIPADQRSALSIFTFDAAGAVYVCPEPLRQQLAT
jgi:hypothetical protein